ncbi:MAG: beta-galactosidase trimerization domain-containing protein [Rhodanobacter sp.]
MDCVPITRQPLKFSLHGKELTGSDGYYAVLEPSTAKVLATFENTPGESPAITINHFGKGKAIDLATASQASFMGAACPIALYRA